MVLFYDYVLVPTHEPILETVESKVDSIEDEEDEFWKFSRRSKYNIVPTCVDGLDTNESDSNPRSTIFWFTNRGLGACGHGRGRLV